MLNLHWDNPILPGFIVFEGLDGAGTTTQAQRLVDHLTATGREAVFTWEPTDFRTGMAIRDLIVGPEHAEPWTLALLFAADRYEHLNRPEYGIRALLDRGVTVVSDRYLFSSIAYQGALCDAAAVERINHQFPLPEHVVFVDTPLDEAGRRLSQRPQRDQLEQAPIQQRVAARYRGVMDAFAAHSATQVHPVNGEQDPEQVFREIVAALGLDPVGAE